MEVILTAICSVLIAIVNLISNHYNKKDNRMLSARHSILMLIFEDKVNVLEGKLPENRYNVQSEYDEYRANGGNSYIHDKVEDYLEWYDQVEKSYAKNKTKGTIH